jgi:hypothetical protein
MAATAWMVLIGEYSYSQLVTLLLILMNTHTATYLISENKFCSLIILNFLQIRNKDIS